MRIFAEPSMHAGVEWWTIDFAQVGRDVKIGWPDGEARWWIGSQIVTAATVDQVIRGMRNQGAREP